MFFSSTSQVKNIYSFSLIIICHLSHLSLIFSLIFPTMMLVILTHWCNYKKVGFDVASIGVSQCSARLPRKAERSGSIFSFLSLEWALWDSKVETLVLRAIWLLQLCAVWRCLRIDWDCQFWGWAWPASFTGPPQGPLGCVYSLATIPPAILMVHLLFLTFRELMHFKGLTLWLS